MNYETLSTEVQVCARDVRDVRDMRDVRGDERDVRGNASDVRGERVIPMYGANPIRGMVTSLATNICSQYGSSSIQASSIDYYMGTEWCRVGVLLQEHQPIMYAMESRFLGNQWEARALEPISGLAVYLETIGSGPYGSFRNNETVSIPGRSGHWKFQLQTQPYFLYA